MTWSSQSKCFISAQHSYATLKLGYDIWSRRKIVLFHRFIFEANLCDQIGRFLKVLGKIISYKSSPNIWWLFGLFRKTSLKSKHSYGYFFGQLLDKFGLLLILTSGHTVLVPPRYGLSLIQEASFWNWCVFVFH